MKKWMASLLALSVLAGLTMTGCGEKKEAGNESSSQLAQRAAVHQRLPLTGSELELLARLWMAEEPVTPLGLSRSMGLQQVNVSRLIRGLRARALVAAAPSPTDRRSYTLSLTQAGRQALQDGCRAYLSPLYRMREGLGEAEFTRLMEEITQANRRLDAAAVKGGGEPCPSMD